jgi:hypothetical protein
MLIEKLCLMQARPLSPFSFSFHPSDSDLSLRTKSFALQIIQLFSSLPKTIEAQVIGKQMLRSGTSVEPAHNKPEHFFR